jgi:hypothetical protein
MLPSIFILALAFASLVSAHGKVTVVTGNAGGNGTALGIRGGVVPNKGPNFKVNLPAPPIPQQPSSLHPTNPFNFFAQTEVDTTIFGNPALHTDGLGRTTGSGENTLAMIIDAMHLSGTTLPQITADGGSLTGT